MIIFRYLIKEIFSTVLASTSILLLIFLSTQFIHYLTGAALGKYTAEILFQVMMLQVPYLLGLLMPIGLYVALLLAYGRLHGDREMVVLSCCGMSQWQLIRYTLTIAIVVMVIVGFINMQVTPIILTKQKELFAKAKAAPLIETLLPGRFLTSNNENQVLYVEKTSNSNHQGGLENMFIADQAGKLGNFAADNKSKEKKPAWTVVNAAYGYEEMTPQGKFLIILKGHRYQGTPGSRDFQIINFNKYALRLSITDPPIKPEPKTMSTAELWHQDHNDPQIAAELQWRLSMPLSVILLALLAIPLSYVNPRQGRFAQLIPAVLLYIFYANLMFLDRSWIQLGYVPAALGVWWVHGTLLFITLILLAWRGQWLAFLKRGNSKKQAFIQ